MATTAEHNEQVNNPDSIDSDISKRVKVKRDPQPQFYVKPQGTPTIQDRYRPSDRWMVSGTRFTGDVGAEPEYDKGIMLSDIIDDPNNLNRIRGRNQDWTDQLGRAIWGGLRSAPYTAMEDISYALDPNTWGSLLGIVNAESNAVADYAAKAREGIRQDNMIYSSSGDSMDISDPATYYNMLQSAVDSGVGFGIGGGLISGGLGTLGKVSRIASLIKEGSLAAKYGGTILNGFVQNVAEGKQVALEGWREGKSEIETQKMQLLNDKMQKLMLAEESVQPTLVNVGTKEKPSYTAMRELNGKLVPVNDYLQFKQNEIRQQVLQEVNAWGKKKEDVLANSLDNIQRANLVNLASDAFAMRGLMKGLNGVTRADLAKSAFSKATEGFRSVKGAGNMLLGMAGQGFEEAEQEVIKREVVGKAVRPDDYKDTSVLDRVGDYMSDPNVKQAFWSGVMGSPVQASTTTLIGNVSDIYNRKKVNEYNTNLANAQAAANEYNRSVFDNTLADSAGILQRKEEALKRGDKIGAEQADEALFSSMVYRNAAARNMHNLERNLEDLASNPKSTEDLAARTEMYGEGYQNRAKEWLGKLKQAEDTFIKAHQDATDTQGNVDELKRSSLFTLSNQITANDNIINELDNELDKISNSNEKEKLLSEFYALTDTRDNLAREWNKRIARWNEGSPTDRLKHLFPDFAKDVHGSVTMARLDKKRKAIYAKIEELDDTELPLNAVELDKLNDISRKKSDLVTLNESLGQLYTDIRNGKTDLTEVQQGLLAEAESRFMGSPAGKRRQVNETLVNETSNRPVQEPTTKPTRDELLSEAVADYEFNSMEEAESIYSNVSNQVQEAANRVVNEGADPNEFVDLQNQYPTIWNNAIQEAITNQTLAEEEANRVAERNATRDLLYDQTLNRDELTPDEVDTFTQLATDEEDADLPQLIRELQEIREGILSGTETIPDGHNTDNTVKIIDQILKALNIATQVDTDAAYSNVNHAEDAQKQSDEDALANNEYDHDRKLKAVNALAYNATDVQDPRARAFVDFVQDATNNLEGMQVQYVLPEATDLDYMNDKQKKAYFLLVNGNTKTKADRAAIYTHLPVRVELQPNGQSVKVNGFAIGTFLHATDYAGYSPAIQEHVDTFNMTRRTQIIDSLLNNIPVYGKVEKQRGGYLNRQFWYGNPSNKTVVNTQNAEEMARFNKALNTQGSKAKRTPMHNQISSVVNTITLRVANANGEIEGAKGKTKDRIYFKATRPNGDTTWIPAYVRSLNDQLSLLKAVKSDMSRAKVDFSSELTAIAKANGVSLGVLTSEQVIRTLVNNADAVIAADVNEVGNLIKGKRTRVDYARLNENEYIEYLTEGSDPILYTNAAKFTNNSTVPSLFVQPTVELSTDITFSKPNTEVKVEQVQVTPPTVGLLTTAGVDQALSSITDATLKAKLKIALMSMSRKDVKAFADGIRVLQGDLNVPYNVLDESLRAVGKSLGLNLNDGLNDPKAASNLYTSFALGEDTFRNEFKKMYPKTYKAFTNVESFVKSVESNTLSNINNLLNAEIVNPDTLGINNSGFTTEQMINIAYDLVSNDPTASYTDLVSLYSLTPNFDSNVLTELQNPKSELAIVTQAIVKATNKAVKDFPHLRGIYSNTLTVSSNAPKVNGILAEAFANTTLPETENPTDDFKAAVADKLVANGQAELGETVRTLNKADFKALEQRYSSVVSEGYEDIESVSNVPETLLEEMSTNSLPTQTIEQALTENPDKVIFDNRDIFAEHVGQGMIEVGAEGINETEQAYLDHYNSVRVETFGDLLYKAWLANNARILGYTIADQLYTQDYGMLNDLVSHTIPAAVELINQLGLGSNYSDAHKEALKLMNATGFQGGESLTKLLPVYSKNPSTKLKDSNVNGKLVDARNGVDVSGRKTFAPLILVGGKVHELVGTVEGEKRYGVYTEVGSKDSEKASTLPYVYPPQVPVSVDLKYQTDMIARANSNKETTEEQELSSEHFANTNDVDITSTVKVGEITYEVRSRDGKIYAKAEGKQEQVAPESVRVAYRKALIEQYDRYCK